jgi:seryl-tRNA synthetase
MLTIDFIKNNIEAVKKNIVQRGFDPAKADVDKLLEIDAKKNKIQLEADQLRQKRNENTDTIRNLGGKPTPELIAEGKKLKEQIASIESGLAEIKQEWTSVMAWMPNMAFDDIPVGGGPRDNIEIKAWSKQDGYLPQDKLSGAEGSASHIHEYGSNADDGFVPVPHWEIGKKLDIIDIEAGSKVSGSRFYYLKKEGQETT